MQLQFWLLAALLVLIFVTGGSSRADVQSLVLLRPASIVACGIAILTLKREHAQRHKWLLIGFAATILVSALHITPLWPAVWGTLGGREDIGLIDEAVALGQVWRPLTLVPANGQDALASLSTPLAVILFGIQLNRDNLYRLIPLLIGLGAVSGLSGLLQAVGSTNGPLYFYEITNNGSAVGLFANRNHAAVLLAILFPMLAIFASTSTGTDAQQKSRQLAAAALSMILIPLILVTGSRSGLLVGLVGMAGAALMYRPPQPNRHLRQSAGTVKIGARAISAGFAVICLVFLTLFFSRAAAVDRLFSQSAIEDQRLGFWAKAMDASIEYFPWGSGLGSFAETYRVSEPSVLLDSTYLNHAHNDWLEISTTMGLTGMMVLGVAVLLFGHRIFHLWFRMDGMRQSVKVGRMAGVIIVMFSIASAFDYPLRTPTLMSLFAVTLLWLMESESQKQSPARQTAGGNVD